MIDDNDIPSDEDVRHAVLTLFRATGPGQTMLFKVQVTHVVVRPGEKPPVAMLLVTNPVAYTVAVRNATRAEMGG